MPGPPCSGKASSLPDAGPTELGGGTWRQTADGISDLPDGALAACMFCYSRLHGAIVLELAGHVPP
jgi:hypothetical protein